MFRVETHRPERRRVWSPTFSLQSLSKRAFDLVVATAGLLLLSPLIIFVSLGIRIVLSRPILWKHKYYNSNNVEFDLLEFRTGRVDQQGRISNCRLDQIECCTSIEQILRRSSLNKLPQLLNVFKGEISIVGSHLFSHPVGSTFPPLDLGEVKPGLVSWAYAHDDAHEIADESKRLFRCIECDRYYIDKWSFAFDMKLLGQTFLSKKNLLRSIDRY
jgi:lipopolysaccharide/colanic/teichoic acid biosynthesis glycosyltransferase